jgi:hypothetical protein
MLSRRPSALGMALWAASALAIIVLVAWCLALPGRTPPAFPEGDPAVLELYTWQAAHGFWEYGPYSRFGWHHPGPIFFYLLAPFYIASQHHTLALDAGALAINLVAVAIVGWGLTRFLERRVAVLVLVSLAWYAFHIARLLTSAWNPHVLLLPLFGLVVAGSIVMAGRLAWLPLLVAIGSFIAQTHVGLVPCVAAVCACAAIGGWLRADASKMKWLAISAGVGLLLWFPAIIEWRNLAAIAHFFGPSGPTEATVSFSDAVTVWAETLTAPARANLTVPYGNAIAMRHTVLFPALAVAEIVLLAMAAWRWRVTQRHTESALALLCAVASVIALMSIARIRGGLADHLVGWVTTLGVLNVAVLIGFALTAVVPERFEIRAFVVPLGSLALVLVVMWYGVSRIEWQRQELVRRSNNGRTPAQALYQELRSTMGKTHIRKPLLHAAVLSWPQAAGIALQLTKKDAPFASDLIWLFGPQVTPHGDEDADITIADTPTRHALAPRPGDCMLIERHGTSIHLLALPPDRFAGLQCVAP